MSNEFRKRIRQAIADGNLQLALDNNASRRRNGRLAAFAQLPDFQERRQRAHAVKAEVIARLDAHLEQFIARVTANGIQIHRAADSDEAIRIFMEIAHMVGAKVGAKHASPLPSPLLVAKSKSMVSEEINFNHALEAAGIRVVETDLGEYIVQLRGERPSHIITPAVHLRRGDVGKLFAEKLGIPYTEEIPILTNTARKVLRDIFLTADIGVSGVNFGVAETGTLVLVTNEGNGRMCTTVPPVHVALMGIERLVPTLDDLALFLSLLPRSATGQKLSVYTSLIHSPRRPGEVDGPLERHLILVDNGRSRLRNSPLAESLYCIRCGACLNACPVFREIGGHAYRGRDGSIAPYPGPIGSVVSPGLFGCENFGHLAQTSSLCGACREACPVDIDLPGMLLRVRAGGEGKRKTKNKKRGLECRKQSDSVCAVSASPRGTVGLFAVFQAVGGLFSRVYSPRRAYMRLPAWTGWGFSKDFPRLAVKPFRVRWKKVRQVIRNEGNQGIRGSGKAPLPDPLITKSLITRFTDELAALGGKVYPVSEKELPSRLTDFLKTKGVDRVYVDDVGATFIVAQMQGQAQALPLQVIHESDPSIRCGVTGALCGIAESGSLVLVGGAGRPMTASLLPEIHIAILKASRIMPTVAEALRQPEVRQAAAGVIITGPSRTADIEMTLTIGVHGPGEIHVFLIDDSTAV